MNTNTNTNTAQVEAQAQVAASDDSIDWGSVAKSTAIVGGVAAGTIVASGIAYALIYKVAKATYELIS